MGADYHGGGISNYSDRWMRSRLDPAPPARCQNQQVLCCGLRRVRSVSAEQPPRRTADPGQLPRGLIAMRSAAALLPTFPLSIPTASVHFQRVARPRAVRGGVGAEVGETTRALRLRRVRLLRATIPTFHISSEGSATQTGLPSAAGANKMLWNTMLTLHISSEESATQTSLRSAAGASKMPHSAVWGLCAMARAPSAEAACDGPCRQSKRDITDDVTATPHPLPVVPLPVGEGGVHRRLRRGRGRGRVNGSGGGKGSNVQPLGRGDGPGAEAAPRRGCAVQGVAAVGAARRVSRWAALVLRPRGAAVGVVGRAAPVRGVRGAASGPLSPSEPLRVLLLERGEHANTPPGSAALIWRRTET
eukprot:gene3027-biopygen12518